MSQSGLYPFVRRHCRDVFPQQVKTARVSRQLSGNDVEERRLSCAVRPDDGDIFSRLNAEGNTVQYETAEALAQSLNLKRFHDLFSASPRAWLGEALLLP